MPATNKCTVAFNLQHSSASSFKREDFWLDKA